MDFPIKNGDFPYFLYIYQRVTFIYIYLSHGFILSSLPQVVTLELRSLEQRLNHGSVSAGAMDEANEAMAKAQRRNGGKTLGRLGGKKVERPGENVGKRWEKWENWKRLGWF